MSATDYVNDGDLDGREDDGISEAEGAGWRQTAEQAEARAEAAEAENARLREQVRAATRSATSSEAATPDADRLGAEWEQRLRRAEATGDHEAARALYRQRDAALGHDPFFVHQREQAAEAAGDVDGMFRAQGEKAALQARQRQEFADGLSEVQEYDARIERLRASDDEAEKVEADRLTSERDGFVQNAVARYQGESEHQSAEAFYAGEMVRRALGELAGSGDLRWSDGSEVQDETLADLRAKRDEVRAAVGPVADLTSSARLDELDRDIAGRLHELALDHLRAATEAPERPDLATAPQDPRAVYADAEAAGDLATMIAAQNEISRRWDEEHRR